MLVSTLCNFKKMHINCFLTRKKQLQNWLNFRNQAKLLQTFLLCCQGAAPVICPPFNNLFPIHHNTWNTCIFLKFVRITWFRKVGLNSAWRNVMNVMLVTPHPLKQWSSLKTPRSFYEPSFIDAKYSVYFHTPNKHSRLTIDTSSLYIPQWVSRSLYL